MLQHVFIMYQNTAMSALVAVFTCIAYYAVLISSVPPQECFANFKWEDCGGPPQPVMYYWKPGSRCEVGIWRGCLPNMNMFKDEYECVSTCIFAVRVRDGDYHQNLIDDPDYSPTTETVVDDGSITIVSVDEGGSTRVDKENVFEGEEPKVITMIDVFETTPGNDIETTTFITTRTEA